MKGNKRMVDKITKTQVAFFGALAFIAERFGTLGILILVLTVLFAFDFVSGWIATIIQKQNGDITAGLSSKKGLVGICKKIAYYLVVCMSMLLDYVIITTVDFFGLSLPIKTFFGTLVCLAFVLNEMVSIIENVERAGIVIPNWLKTFITKFIKKVDEKGDSIIDTTTDTN